MTPRKETEPTKVPAWVWTSDVVMGWCDSSGCESIGHENNRCKLAVAFAAHLARRDEARDAELLKPWLSAVERLVGEIKRERIGESSYRGMDHACDRCPGATMVIDGFLCPLHFGEALLSQPAAEEAKPPLCDICGGRGFFPGQHEEGEADENCHHCKGSGFRGKP